MSDREFGFEIDVPVRNEWENVALLVTSVQNCFNAMFSDVEGSQTVAMVTGELLENAIKYGIWTGTDQHLRLRVRGRSKKAFVTVENPAGPAEVADLRRTLQWMDGHENAEAAFRARLLAIAQTADPDVSKLGIVRVAYQGRAVIKAEFVEPVLRVTAEVEL